jgi:hypothetical protein
MQAPNITVSASLLFLNRFFDLEDGSSTFLQNIDTYFPNYLVSRPRNPQPEALL